MNNQIVTVNLTPGGSAPAVVRVSQGDIGRPILFKVLDGTGPAAFASGTVAKIQGTKPTGLGFNVTGSISGNTVTVSTTEEMTQEAGMIMTEIRFSTTSPATDIGTANFILAVEPETHNASTTDGTYETMADLEARVAALESGQSGTGLTDEEKQLILDLFAKAAYADDDAALSYDELAALWAIITRSVLLSLTHVTSSNTSASVEDGASYTTTLTADTNYTLNTVSVTMGGVDITSTAYSSGTVSIASVTGNIVITATAVASGDVPIYNWNFTSSLTDTIAGKTAVINSDSTRDSSGVHLVGTGTNNTGAYIELITDAKVDMTDKTVVIEVAGSPSTPSTAQHMRLFGICDTLGTSNSGASSFLWRYNNNIGWTIYKGSGWTSITLNNTTYPIDYFTDKKIKLYISDTGIVTLSSAASNSDTYTELQTWTGNALTKTNGYIMVGSQQDDVVNGFVIKQISIYEGEV